MGQGLIRACGAGPVGDVIGMEWLMFMLADWSCLPPVALPGAEPGRDDLWLAQIMYEFVAGRTRCAKCGAALGRGIHPMIGTPWRIVVVTRCSGWRRHRHTAVVTEASDGLNFGRLIID